MSQMTLAIILFVAMYVLLLTFQNFRHWIAVGFAVLFIALRILPLSEIAGSIDFNVLLMIAGTMGLISLFIESGMPNRMADKLVSKVPNVKWAIIALAMFAGIISAFVDNVATVLMVVPVALSIAKKFKLNPVPMVIAISVSSNLQGAATLVGDTTSIMLGSYANMDFLDFFVFKGKPGMFWVVELGAILTMFVLMWIFRKDTQKIEADTIQEVHDYVPTVLLGVMLVALITVSFIPSRPSITNGVICTALFLIGLVIEAFKNHDRKLFKRHFAAIDYHTLLLLAGLFVVIGGVKSAGVIDAIAGLFTKAGAGNLFAIYSIIVWASVLFSAFIDNIPYTATMLPVVQGIAASLGVQPYLLYFGLLTGATLGGNLTPVGASANITSIGILRKNGFEVKNKDFFKIGVPFSLVAVLSGYILLWIIWA